jgi:hypothetical protein
MCFGQLSSVGGWHTLVIITVQQQQWSWSKALSSWHWPEPAQLASPFIEVFWKLRSLHRTDRTTVIQKLSRLCSPVIEVSPWAQQRTAFNARVIGTDTHC